MVIQHTRKYYVLCEEKRLTVTCYAKQLKEFSNEALRGIQILQGKCYNPNLPLKATTGKKSATLPETNIEPKNGQLEC